MTITRNAYEKHNFIRTSIDLLCAGVSWRGGSFISEEDGKGKNLPALDEELLVEFARSMLLDGKAYVGVTSTEGKFKIEQIPDPDASKSETIITIERVESSFSLKGEPILERIGSNIELYEKALEQYSIIPAADELLDYVLPSIHSSLAIPSSMLDQTRITQVPVEALMMGAIQYQAEVEQLRHNLRYGLNQIGDLVAGILDIDIVSWEWNENWIVEGPCKYGYVYQVFKSKGIALSPIMDSELGGMKLALQAGLISNHTYSECAASYGLE